MLDGRLRVMVSYGFLPPSGTQLRILQAGSRTGEFSELTVENTSSRLEFEQLHDPTGIVLSVSHRELATFLEWQTASFSAQDLTNPAVSGAQADPDGDRFANALEYALDLRPSLVDDNPLSFGVERDESGTPVAITLSFPWAKGMTDAEYEVVRSSDLNDWETVETVIVKIEDRGTCNKLTLSPIPFLKTEQSAYVQLIVALTPQIVEP